MTTHPSGWAETTLGALGNYWNGRGFKKSEWRPEGQGRQIIRIQDLTGSHQTPNYFDGDIGEHHVARKGDILVSWAATLGVFQWSGPEAVINQHIFKVDSFIDPSFHRYLIESVLSDLRRRSHGTGMVHVTRNVFDETAVWLPPIREQGRIVAVIEEQFSRLDEAEHLLRRCRRRAERLRTVAMAAALSEGWPMKALADVTIRQEYGSSAKATATPGNGVPMVRMGNVQGGHIDLSSNVKYLVADHPDAARYELHSGDLLFNRTNSPELVGKSAVFRGPSGSACFASYLIRVQLHECCLPEWASLYLNSPSGRRWAASVRSQQVGQANINGSKLAAMPFPLPPVDEQDRILSEVERHISLVDAAIAVVDGALIRVVHLRRAVLGRGFSGKLVPQDPSDQPASELLASVNVEDGVSNRSRRRKRS